MAKRSPPTPFETGSIHPSVAFAAIAASTASPPRFRMSIPTCVAAGTLVQTIPCRARTSERVAKFLPVMRSIWAEEKNGTAANAKIDKRITRCEVMEAKLSERSCGASRELSSLPFRDRAEVVSRNRGPASSNCFHVDPSLHRHLDPAFAARSRARRAIVRRRHQKSPFYADPNAEAEKEEERVRDEEEVADAVSIKKVVAGTGERITDAIGHSIAEKEGKFVHGRGIGVAVAQPEEENNLAHAFAKGLAASKEKDFANPGAR